ncbi:MAG: hypothetical protein K6G00_11170 [Treponema sp.]|nr:hypothetical protein [Treponema sp.]
MKEEIKDFKSGSKIKDPEHSFSTVQYTPTENAVMALYPQFQKEYQVLIDSSYMQKNGDKLQWLKSTKSLAVYFGYMKCADNSVHWKEIEILFSKKHLYQSFQNAQTINKSKDYKNLQKILSM